MRKTYSGSCHCGAVRFEADVDLEAGTGKCNCSICAKTRAWNIAMKPADFRLISGADQLSDYQFGTMSGHHRFCRACGVRTHGHGYVEEIGGDFVAINVAALDGVDDATLAALPVSYADGRNDNWMKPPTVTAYL